MIESTDVCHSCKNFENTDKKLICDNCCHGKQDNFEPIIEQNHE